MTLKIMLTHNGGIPFNKWDVVNDEGITTSEVVIFLQILKIDKGAVIHDMCCGQERHSFEFFERGYINITALERSSREYKSKTEK